MREKKVRIPDITAQTKCPHSIQQAQAQRSNFNFKQKVRATSARLVRLFRLSAARLQLQLPTCPTPSRSNFQQALLKLTEILKNKVFRCTVAKCSRLHVSSYQLHCAQAKVHEQLWTLYDANLFNWFPISQKFIRTSTRAKITLIFSFHLLPDFT